MLSLTGQRTHVNPKIRIRTRCQKQMLPRHPQSQPSIRVSDDGQYRTCGNPDLSIGIGIEHVLGYRNPVYSLNVLQGKNVAKPYCACTVPATPCRLPRNNPMVLRSGSRRFASRGNARSPTSLYPLRFMQSSTNLYS